MSISPLLTELNQWMVNFTLTFKAFQNKRLDSNQGSDYIAIFSLISSF